MTFVDEMENLKIPKVTSRIPFKLHDDYEWIVENYNQWMIKESFPAKYVAENHLRWFCQVCSNATIDKQRLLVMAKLQILFFLIDDKVGELAEDNNYNGLEMYLNGLIEDFMDYTKVNESSAFEAKHFREIWIEMLPDLPEKLSNRVVNTICDFFKIMKYVYINYKKEGKYIGLEAYLNYRNADICSLELLVLAEYSLGFEFSDEILNSKDYKELIVLCFIREYLENDILSFKVELPRGEIMNYCIAYLYDKQCSLQEAVDNGFKFLTEIDERYDACIERLLENNKSIPKEFIDVCIGLSDGVVWWHLESTRYHSESDQNELKSKLIEVENKIKRKKMPNNDKFIPLSEVIGEQNAKCYEI